MMMFGSSVTNLIAICRVSSSGRGGRFGADRTGADTGTGAGAGAGTAAGGAGSTVTITGSTGATCGERVIQNAPNPAITSATLARAVLRRSPPKNRSNQVIDSSPRT